MLHPSHPEDALRGVSQSKWNQEINQIFEKENLHFLTHKIFVGWVRAPFEQYLRQSVLHFVHAKLIAFDDQIQSSVSFLVLK